MAALPEPITALISVLGKLPGIGPRSAERLALHLAQSDKESVLALARQLTEAREKVGACEICGALTEKQPCSICDDPRRDATIICVVEKPTDILALEKSGSFHGKYHVLGGKLSPLRGTEPEDLRISELEKRIQPGGVTEVILALATDVEGDATSFYLGKRLAPMGAKINRIGFGLPAGAGLEFTDQVTLTRALESRRPL